MADPDADRFLAILRDSPALMRVLRIARDLDLPDWFLVSGALYNRVWNALTGRPGMFGVKDIDLFYFDSSDLSWEAEDRVIRRAAALFPPAPPVEIRNQARVHLWFESHFGQPRAPLRDSRDAIDGFASRTHCVGVRLEPDDGLTLYAPHGLSDIFAMRLVPNPVLDNRATYEAKARRQAALWPELTVLPWPAGAPGRTMDRPRRLSPDDPALDLALALMRGAFAHMDGVVDPPSSIHRLTPDDLRAGPGEVWVAGDSATGDPVVACMVLTPRAGALYLGKLAVAAGMRRRGLARRMIDAAEARARDLSLPFVELQTRVELAANHAAFRAMGFAETGRSAHPGHDRPTTITFRRPVAGAEAREATPPAPPDPSGPAVSAPADAMKGTTRMSIERKFARLASDDAPGQEVRQSAEGLDGVLKGERLDGRPVDFSHGDVDAHPPAPGAFDAFAAGVERGGAQAYTEYRGDLAIRETIAPRLAAFTGAPVDAADGLILTPGTQAALFLAVASTVTRGDRVAIVQPDYFANRKLVEFLEAEMMPVPMDYAGAAPGEAGLDLDALEAAFRAGARTFLFSNPNNPAGTVCSPAEIAGIATLAARYGVTVIVDQLYSRLLYRGGTYTHLRAAMPDADNLVTIMGPSKTESLSGYRLGAAFGAAPIIARMEKLQAIVSLRAPGYSQAVLRGWFAEPEGWMDDRIARHQAIRDDLVAAFSAIPGCRVRAPEAGSYLFPRLPALTVTPAQFVGALRAQAGVTVTPGTEFSPHCADSIRLNFSQDHAAAVAAAGRLATLVERYRA